MAQPVYDPSLQATGAPVLPDFAEVMMDDLSIEDRLEAGEELEVDENGVVAAPAKEGELQQASFNANLAELIDEDELEKIGAKLVELVEDDDETRADWYKRVKRGLESLGVYESTEEDGDDRVMGITKVSHPLILEAVTQFQARAFSELYPAKGPVKGAIIGEDHDPEKFAQALRVERFMNYQLTIDDREYYDERDQMLYMLPLTGSEFDKQYNCPIEEKNLSRWVRCDDLIVNNAAKSLRTAPRVTHRLTMTEEDYKAMVTAGAYLDVELETESDDGNTNEVKLAIKKMDEADGAELAEEDVEYVFFESHTKWQLPVDIDGGEKLPYVITVDKETKKVLSIKRNWKENDPRRRARMWFTHKRFLPGLGFYGFGLLHVIGSLGEAATKILNILIDSGAYSSFQGGFKSKDAKLAGDVELTPGEWKDTELTAEELSKAFYTPPFREPSQTLFSLLGNIVDLGRRFASTVDAMVGDAGTSGPVGNIVAQIEQGSKVFSGIHRRLHKSVGDELIHLSELNGEHLPDAYPFTFNGVQDSVLRSDFDDRIDIIPVSDPNIFSASQRIALAQTAVQTIQQYPQLNGDLRSAVIEMLEAMSFPTPERYFPPPETAVRTDPVTEGVFCTIGKPVKAYIDQNHDAHLAVHQFQLATFQQQQNPQAAQAMQAHIQEHTAMQMYTQLVQAMQQAPMQAQQQLMQMQQMAQQNPMAAQDPQFMQQVNVLMQQAQTPPMAPPIDWENPMGSQQLSPEQENEIAMKAAEAAQQLFAQMQQQQDPGAAEAAAKAQAAKEAAQIGAQATIEAAKISAGASVQKAQIDSELKAQIAQMDSMSENAKLQLDRFQAMLEDRRKRDEVMAKIRSDREIAILKLNAEQDTARRQEMQASIDKMDEELKEEPEDDGAELEAMQSMMEGMMKTFQESMAQLTDKLTAPKRIITDKNGKPIGVEPATK